LPLPPLYAHRLGRAYGPDSSLQALERTLAAPVDGLETDCCLTADGELVLLHDPLFPVGTTLDGWAHERTGDEIRAARLRDAGGRPTDQRPLALDERSSTPSAPTGRMSSAQKRSRRRRLRPKEPAPNREVRRSHEPHSTPLVSRTVAAARIVWQRRMSGNVDKGRPHPSRARQGSAEPTWRASPLGLPVAGAGWTRAGRRP
jgi:glycerophosphoryl diester phosphodiesterase